MLLVLWDLHILTLKLTYRRQLAKHYCFQKYYLTHFDILVCNTFIGTSGFIIILVTIDRWRCICSPTSPEDTRPGLYCAMALLVSFLWQVPRLVIKTTQTDCVRLDSNMR